MKTTIAIILISICVTISCAQSGIIKGTVFDSTTSVPVIYAAVWLEPGTIGTTTDTSGFFELLNIPTGTYTFHASHVGHYNIAGQEISVFMDHTHVVNVNLPTCPFYTLGRSNLCPKCEKSDRVVPIVYGKPTPETLVNAANGEVKLAGCLTPECAPSNYCKRDSIEF